MQQQCQQQHTYDELGEKWPVTNNTLTTGGHHLEFGPWPCCTFLARPCFGRTLPMVMTWTICSAHGPVTPSSLGPWPCYLLISFACAALEFRLSPNLRIEVRAEKHRHRHQKHTSSYRHHRPLQIKLPSIYMSFSNPRYHYHIRRFWDVWMVIHRRHFM